MTQILIDTNILIHVKSATSPDHERAKADVERLIIAGHELFVCPQVLREFYKVMTTPKTSNGIGLSPDQAKQELQSIVNTYSLTEDSNRVFAEWQTLVDTYQVSGKNAHDTHIVACMRMNAIDGILTYNTKDFRRFDSFISLHP